MEEAPNTRLIREEPKHQLAILLLATTAGFLAGKAAEILYIRTITSYRLKRNA